MSCATAKKEGSSRYANSIRARSTRLAGSVRERAIAPNSTKSFSPIANSIACRHAVMSSTLSANQSRKPRTHVGKCESSTYDGFHGIDVLVTQDGISVHVNPVGGLGGHVAPLAIGMVVGRGGLKRLVRVEPRPSPPVAPQRVAGVRSLAVSHHDEPALELVGVAYFAGGHLVRRCRDDLFHQDGAVREL